ncbi:restriction endonuclease subunit S [Bacteroides uniformis]|uniref:restriction endonuclease subunit S n=1 Tax=Bacteroides uniformis TaxID=820 RepID=UPI003983F766
MYYLFNSANGYNNNLAKTKIAVPDLAEQERIVSILDKFEALTNDLSQGLPAEIAAVQEQYEYYRDKLLSFPKNKKISA